MGKPGYKLRKVKYTSKDSKDLLFEELNRKKNLYFSVNKISKYGNSNLAFKAGLLIFVGLLAYLFILSTDSFFQLQTAYLIFGACWLIIGINFGHDAAHNCLTGNKKLDNTIFELIFGLQGINGYLWKIRHNHSHHPFPNVYDHDSDLEITNLLYLNSNQRKRKAYYYQHLYAPLLYMFISLTWIFYIDFSLYRKKNLANLISISHRKIELVKLILFKISSLFFFLFLPLMLSPLPAVIVIVSFIVMHLCLSLVLTFIFFVSHHVTETEFISPGNGLLDSSWVEQQVSSTLDFHAESKAANFIFGGFSAHLAHHIFPDVCHIHYPALTALIKQSLMDHNIRYNSLSLVKAVKSHLIHLKSLPRKEAGLA